MHQSPECLWKLCVSRSDHILILLNFSDHRFVAMSKALSVGLQGDLSQQSKSKSFNCECHVSWLASLKTVHKWLWNKYHALAPKKQPIAEHGVQEPGVIPDLENMVSLLSVIMAAMPPKVDYAAGKRRKLV